MKKQSLAIIVTGLLTAGRVLAGSLDPTNAPGPTMHTLEEIYQKQVDTYQKVQNLAPQTLQTLSATTDLLTAGYYAATNLTQVDTDLTAANIKTNVTIFGIAGTLSTNVGGNTYSAAVPKTGQTNTYQAGDDGTYQKGVAWPNPRFTIQADSNCVLDNLTGLIWARNANLDGEKTWSAAIIYCEDLTYGGYDDWRLPNRRELLSLIDDGRVDPALPTGHPFSGVQYNVYWSDTSCPFDEGQAWYVEMHHGDVNYYLKSDDNYVWPVRGGQ